MHPFRPLPPRFSENKLLKWNIIFSFHYRGQIYRPCGWWRKPAQHFYSVYVVFFPQASFSWRKTHFRRGIFRFLLVVQTINLFRYESRWARGKVHAIHLCWCHDWFQDGASRWCIEKIMIEKLGVVASSEELTTNCA